MGVGLCEFESHRPHKEAASSDAAFFCAVTNQKMPHNEENWLPGHFWRQHGNSRARGEPYGASFPQRPTCSRRKPYIPAAVLATWFRLLIFGWPDITVHGTWQRR